MSVTKKVIPIMHTITYSRERYIECPFKTCMCLMVPNPIVVGKHLVECHPQLATKMYLTDKLEPKAYICKGCNTYTNHLHPMCQHCPDKCFASHNELILHLKTVHPIMQKIYMETECKWKDKCRGFDTGGCGFNHCQECVEFTIKTIPSSLCNSDASYILGQSHHRCTRVKCPFNHIRGRMKWLVEQQTQKATSQLASSMTEVVLTDDLPETTTTSTMIEKTE